MAHRIGVFFFFLFGYAVWDGIPLVRTRALPGTDCKGWWVLEGGMMYM